MKKKHINRAIHWDGRGGQAWYEGTTHHLRLPPRVNGEPVHKISYYPLSNLKTGCVIVECRDMLERIMTREERAELDMRLELMSKVGLAVWE